MHPATYKCRKQHLLLVDCDHYMQETDDNEPQLEDTVDPAPAVTQSADSLPGERDIPVNIHLLTRALRINVKVGLCSCVSTGYRS